MTWNIKSKTPRGTTTSTKINKPVREQLQSGRLSIPLSNDLLTDLFERDLREKGRKQGKGIRGTQNILKRYGPFQERDKHNSTNKEKWL